MSTAASGRKTNQDGRTSVTIRRRNEIRRISVRDAIEKLRVCAVTVTYGERWHFLEQVLTELSRIAGIEHVVVVNNGAKYDLEARVKTAFDGLVTVAGSGVNEGSARGFGLGIKEALEKTNAPLVWLLDDDNLPEPGCLEELRAAYSELSMNQDYQNTAVLALRTDRQYLLRVASGISPRKVFSRKNSFLDFHFADAPGRIIRKLFGRFLTVDDAQQQPVGIPFGIYGGLLFHRDVIGRIGYPDESLFLYGDDTDFTARIAAGDGKLFLVPTSRVRDLDRSWHISGRKRKVTVMSNLAEADEFRVYYSVRNGTVVSRRYRLQNRVIWYLNKTVYLFMLRAYMTFTGNSDRYRLICRAVDDGLTGRLGRCSHYAI